MSNDKPDIDPVKALQEREAKRKEQKIKNRERYEKIQEEKALFRRGLRPRRDDDVTIPLMDPEVLKNLGKK